ncbi:MAG TPA: hypothetical protein PLK38_10315, partial [Methanoregulaceae archaeon]|nr:hypothetical protein [Methanoregulaceae archaeon]
YQSLNNDIYIETINPIIIDDDDLLNPDEQSMLSDDEENFELDDNDNENFKKSKHRITPFRISLWLFLCTPLKD